MKIDFIVTSFLVQNKIINFDVDSTSVKTISLTDNDNEYDYTTVYKENQLDVNGFL